MHFRPLSFFDFFVHFCIGFEHPCAKLSSTEHLDNHWNTNSVLVHSHHLRCALHQLCMHSLREKLTWRNLAKLHTLSIVVVRHTTSIFFGHINMVVLYSVCARHLYRSLCWFLTKKSFWRNLARLLNKNPIENACQVRPNPNLTCARATHLYSTFSPRFWSKSKLRSVQSLCSSFPMHF